MKNRLQELADEAMDYSRGWFSQDRYRTAEDMFNAKFTELIVKEITTLCDVYEIEMWTKYKNGNPDGSERANPMLMAKSDAAAELAEIISKHFGV